VNIHQFLTNYKKIHSIEEFLNSNETRLYCKNLVGSQISLLILLKALSQSPNKHLICCADKEKAFYLFDELRRLKENGFEFQLHYFPATFKKPYEIEEIDNANVLRRTEVLTQLHYYKQDKPNEPFLIVTYPEAFFDLVIQPNELSQNCIKIKTGEQLGMKFLIEVLHEYHFTSSFEISEPGEYAQRGCIVDFYSFAYSQPIRILFDGDTIQSIKYFDLESQMTHQELTQVLLIPNTEKISSKEKRISIMEYLGENTQVWIEDEGSILAYLTKLYEISQLIYCHGQEISGGANPVSEPQKLYLTSESFQNQILEFPVIYFGKFQPYGIPFIDFEAIPQPNFKKDFQLLSQHLKNNQEKNITNYIFCDEKQQKRLKDIFHEIEPELQFEGVNFQFFEGFEIPNQGISVFTDHQIFDRYFKYQAPYKPLKNSQHLLKEISQLKPGDYVTHRDFGIAQYGGLHLVKLGENENEMVKLIFKGGSIMYEFVSQLHKISKYSDKDGATPNLSKLGSSDWQKTKSKVKKRVKELAFDIIQLYAKRKASKGFAFSANNYLMQELEATFPYEPTPDQEKAFEDVQRDMESPAPMDRLVCGDVGFGKTEVAIRAAFKAACNGKQVAILAPTTILTFQHYKTFSERLEKFPIRIDFLNRFKTTKEIKETLKKLKEGYIDIIIGTHRLISDDVEFKDLGLLIIDEEQRFGVAAKEKLRLKKANVDTLTLTATPIPRTLQFSLMGVRDMTVIQTPPQNRLAVETVLHRFSKEIIRDAVAYEIFRGGQVFFIHNRIAELEAIGSMIKELVPEAKVVCLHGQVKEDYMEKVMSGFIKGDYNVLVSTTIVESGIDIPNANTIIINEAHSYGLSDLHQMRGRVGRSNRKAFCYLLSPPLTVLPSDAMKRLQAIEEFHHLGAGFQISLKDMDIRGAGDLLGKEQSGFIAEIGYDTYHQILEEAIYELKEEHFSDIFQEEFIKIKEKTFSDVQLDGDDIAYIPEDFIPNPAERLTFYRRIADCKNEEDIKKLSHEMVDRFSIIPPQTLALLDAVRLRWLANSLGFEKLVLKNSKLKAFFPSNYHAPYYQSPVFQAILDFMPHQYDFTIKKQDGKVWLESNNLKTYKQAWFKLTSLWKFVEKQLENQNTVLS
jgi:transcription-repair coupling factor (superfamily II helicase)